jgi:hypothetical protein
VPAAPEKPFFIYLAPGACHGPHHIRDQYLFNASMSGMVFGATF